MGNTSSTCRNFVFFLFHLDTVLETKISAKVSIKAPYPTARLLHTLLFRAKIYARKAIGGFNLR